MKYRNIIYSNNRFSILDKKIPAMGMSDSFSILIEFRDEIPSEFAF